MFINQPLLHILMGFCASIFGTAPKQARTSKQPTIPSIRLPVIHGIVTIIKSKT
jgi:hypothetical protein